MQASMAERKQVQSNANKCGQTRSNTRKRAPPSRQKRATAINTVRTFRSPPHHSQTIQYHPFSIISLPDISAPHRLLSHRTQLCPRGPRDSIGPFRVLVAFFVAFFVAFIVAFLVAFQLRTYNLLAKTPLQVVTIL